MVGSGARATATATAGALGLLHLGEDWHGWVGGTRREYVLVGSHAPSMAHDGPANPPVPALGQGAGTQARSRVNCWLANILFVGLSIYRSSALPRPPANCRGRGCVGSRDRRAPWMAHASLQGRTCGVSREPTHPRPCHEQRIIRAVAFGCVEEKAKRPRCAMHRGLQAIQVFVSRYQRNTLNNDICCICENSVCAAWRAVLSSWY